MALGLSLGLRCTKGTASQLGNYLDSYIGSAAWSLRNLFSSFVGSNVVLVRRLSDNAELGFTAEEVIDGTLTTWTGVATGIVRVWYDQTGNGVNATAVPSVSPIIVSSGTLVTSGGFPALHFPNGNINLTITSTTSLSTFVVAKNDSITSAVQPVITGNVGAGGGQFGWGGTAGGVNGLAVYDGANALSATGEDLDIHLGTAISNGVIGELFVDGTSAASGAFAGLPSLTHMGERPDAVTLDLYGKLSEILLYSTDQSSNRIAIETNINNYYSIY